MYSKTPASEGDGGGGVLDKRKLKFPSFFFPFKRLPRKLCVCDP